MAFSSGPDFDKEMKMLEGVTKTVVSKSTLALVLSEHTTVLRGQVKAATRLEERIEMLEVELKKAQATIQHQGDWIEQLKQCLPWKQRIEKLEASSEHLTITSADHTKRIAVLEEQNEDWARLKSGELPLKASQVFLPKGEGERHARSLEDEAGIVRQRVTNMDDRLAALQGAVSELQELSLRFDKLEKTSKQSADTIQRIVTTLYNVGIDIYGEGDAAAGGINELRRKMEEYTALFEDVRASVDKCQAALVEKADMVKVEARIERKYQEIVTYLHQAINVANDDEEEFKKVSETLQNTVRELMATKADRSELLELHEVRFGNAEMNAKISKALSGLERKMDKDEVMRVLDERMLSAGTMARNSQSTVSESLLAQHRAEVISEVQRIVQSATAAMLDSSATRRHKGLTSFPLDTVGAASGVVPPEAKGLTGIATLGPGGPSLGGGFQVRVGADGKRRGPTKAAVAKDGITGTGIGTTGASSVLSRSGKMQLNNSLSRPGLVDGDGPQQYDDSVGVTYVPPAQLSTEAVASSAAPRDIGAVMLTSAFQDDSVSVASAQPPEGWSQADRADSVDGKFDDDEDFEGAASPDGNNRPSSASGGAVNAVRARKGGR